MSDKIKSCPFCGGEGYIKFDDEPCYHGSKGWHFIECINCHAKTDCTASETAAIAAWNNRVTEEDGKNDNVCDLWRKRYEQ